VGTHAELTALGGVHADLYSLPLRLSGRITVFELANRTGRPARQVGGRPSTEDQRSRT